MTAIAHRFRRSLLGRLLRDEGGVQLIEFAYALPVWILMLLGGAEITNYTTTRMRISQVALHLADNASRMGTGTLLAAKTVSETQVNDVLTGAGLQAGELDLYNNGRVIITDFEELVAGVPGIYKAGWKRCRGKLAYTGSYSDPGNVLTMLTNLLPAQLPEITIPTGSATMYVEVRYTYKPIIAVSWAPAMTITETASMTVRDRRVLAIPTNTEGATVNSCNRYTAT